MESESHLNKATSMEKTTTIIRRSIHSFLQNYNYFTSIAALFVVPFSLSVLLSQCFLPPFSYLSLIIQSRLETLFEAAGFPASSEFFSILALKLSQTLSSSVFTLPFTLSFLLVSKACVIQCFKQHKTTSTFSVPSFSSVLSIFNPLFFTYICNSFMIISANATAFCILFLAFNFLDGFGFSSPTSVLLLSASGAVVYSIILANAIIVSNLGLIISGMEKSGGFMAILKAFVMLRGRTSTALSLALPINLGLAGIESLFQYRILKGYNVRDGQASLMALEGMLIAYLYSIILILDTVMSCIFFKSCKKASPSVNQDGRYSYRIEIAEEENSHFVSLKVCQEFP